MSKKVNYTSIHLLSCENKYHRAFVLRSIEHCLQFLIFIAEDDETPNDEHAYAMTVTKEEALELGES